MTDPRLQHSPSLVHKERYRAEVAEARVAELEEIAEAIQRESDENFAASTPLSNSLAAKWHQRADRLAGRVAELEKELAAENAHETTHGGSDDQ